MLTWNLPADVRQLFAYHFMVNALLAGTIVATVAGAVGWFMVLRRQSFVGHTLAVVSFPGASGAIWLGLSATLGYFAAALVAAAVIATVRRSGSGGTPSGESAVIGTVQAFALACGVLFVSLYGGVLDSLSGLLFGTFLGVSNGQVRTLAVVGALVLVVLTAIGRPLLFASVDADVAAARGIPVRALSVVFLFLLACSAAEVSQITGALLVFALLVMPASAAQRLTARPALSLMLTIIIGVVVTWLALGLAFFSVYPVGFFVTTLGFSANLLAAGYRGVATLSRRQPAASPTVGRLPTVHVPWR